MEIVLPTCKSIFPTLATSTGADPLAVHASTCFRRFGKPSLSRPSVVFLALSACMCVYVVCMYAFVHADVHVAYDCVSASVFVCACVCALMFGYRHVYVRERASMSRH